MEAAPKTEKGEPKAARGKGFSMIGDDDLHNILSKLPALSFASAACVSKSWNTICNRILFSRPKLSSALSLHACPHVAVQEVLEKVLSEPIRPHFAIANVGSGFSLIEAFRLITKRLGSRMPFIISTANGIIGRDSLTNEYREEPRVAMVDQFVTDIKDYTASVSGCASPVGIIMFGEGLVDMKPIIDVLDYAMPMETVIVGDEKGRFLYKSGNESRNVCGSTKYLSDAVALVFARDNDKSIGIGDIQFHSTLSSGVSAVGPIHKAVSVKENCSEHTTWLTARKEGQHEVLDGQRILDDINNEPGSCIKSSKLYIRVTKRRKCCIGSEKPRLITSLAFHGVKGTDEGCLYVNGTNIKTGDYFQFYQSDPNTALSSCVDASSNLKSLKPDGNSSSCHRMRAVAVKKEIFGGLIFSCYGDRLFSRRKIYSSRFTESFPGVPFAGIFCRGEIGRGFSSLLGESNKEGSAHCMRAYSTVYLVMSYTLARPEH
ncbi:F-box/LRR-repeat protein At5g63520-like isoform X2 [Juglans microcarpa x Juglans regia]|uniref:F-box/LRR-repeat protein At5g63520-like isoform X2 n=1 Tax=Juglans microcarpa x Juglans regia TaxID=2249226 RepID=UPI001B7DC0CD|nr:F-box/LRR-repeat protein At5g63520-like isoform X2 [Juglans microcarpa x Juglans regia]